LCPTNAIDLSIKHINRYANVFGKIFPNNQIAADLSNKVKDLASLAYHVHHDEKLDLTDYSIREHISQSTYGWNKQVKKLKEMSSEGLNDTVFVIMLHNVDVINTQLLRYEKKGKHKKQNHKRE
jgi:hypothetical protein